MVLDRPRQRRRRLHPDPGGVLRPRRPQAVARAGVAGAGVRRLHVGLVTELAVTRTVRDAAAVLDAVAAPPPGDPYYAPRRARPYPDEVGADPGRLRIGLMTRPPGGQFEAHPDCVAGAEATGRLLESLGHGVEAAYPEALDDPGYIEKFLVRWTSGVDFNLRYWERRTGQQIGPDDVEPLTWALADQGRSHSAAAYLEAMEYAQAVARDGANWWTDHDLLLTPTLALPPAEIGTIGNGAEENPLMPIVRATPYAIFTAGFNSSGQPAISLPMHWSEDGLPIGIQLVAAYGREDLLLRVAAQLEQAQPGQIGGRRRHLTVTVAPMGQPIRRRRCLHRPAFGGNPAAVCLLTVSPRTRGCRPRPGRDEPGRDRLPRTARSTGDGRPRLRPVRWFSPAVEVELCGHATLACAHVLWESQHVPAADPIRFHTKSGVLTCTNRGGQNRDGLPGRAGDGGPGRRPRRPSPSGRPRRSSAGTGWTCWSSSARRPRCRPWPRTSAWLPRFRPAG